MNTSFDFVTLYFCGAVTAVSATVAMLWVWRVHAREAAVRWWALGYLACAIATVMFALPQCVPVLLAKSLGNLVALASIVLIYVGTLRFLERPVAVRLLALVFVPAALANLYWSLVVDALVPRLLVFAAATTVACGLMSRALWSAAEGPQRAVYRFRNWPIPVWPRSRKPCRRTRSVTCGPFSIACILENSRLCRTCRMWGRWTQRCYPRSRRLFCAGS